MIKRAFGNPPKHTAKTGDSLPSRIAAVLRDQLEKGDYKAGDRFPSQNELAKQFRTSTVTSREALAQLVQEGLLEKRFGSGTYVLDPNANRHVAVLMELDIGHPRTSFFFTRLAQSVRLELEKANLKVRLYTGHTAPGAEFKGLTCPDFQEDIHANRISGVIAIALPSFTEWAHSLVERNIPLVGGDAYGTIIDHPGMIRAGVRRLVEDGRKRLALIGSGGSAMTALFRDTLKEHGLESDAAWVPETGGQPASLGLGWRLFRDVWSARPQKPDGLLVMDDMIFQDAAMAILEADIRVPADLVVVTESNRGHAMHCPFPAIRLENDPDAFAKVYAGLMVDLLRKEAIAEAQVVMPFRVVEPDAAGESAGREAPAGVQCAM